MTDFPTVSYTLSSDPYPFIYDVARDDLQRRFLAKHSSATLL